MTDTIYDLVIIGGGPAGLTAGMYAARARMNTVLVEKMAPGGQIMITDWVENYPGFPEGISGADLSMKMAEQAEKFGLAIEYGEVESIGTEDVIKEVRLADQTLKTKSIIIASGASPKRIGIPGENAFYGKGVSTCATCDAHFFRDKHVVAIGGGDTAVEESLYLTKFVEKVYLVHRRDQLRATKVLQERALANPKIEMVWDSVPTEILGGKDGVTGVAIKNVKTDEKRVLEADGCFVWIGIDPTVDFLGDEVARDDWGFILATARMETSVAGIFVCGDVRNTPIRQVATAVGDAAIAAVSAEHYIESLS